MVIVSRCLSTHVVGSTPTCYTPSTHTVPIPAKFCKFYSCGNEDCLKVVVDPSIELDAAQKTAHIFIVTDAVFIYSVWNSILDWICSVYTKELQQKQQN